MKDIDKRTIDNLIESTRKSSSISVEEMCKRMGIAQSDVKLRKKQVKKGK